MKRMREIKSKNFWENMFGPIIKKVVQLMIQEYGGQAMKSTQTAWWNIVRDNARRNKDPFQEFYQNMESKIAMGTDGIMTRTEASKILNYKESDFPTHNDVGLRCYELFEKNEPKKWGSIYIQAKILNSKDFLIK